MGKFDGVLLASDFDDTLYSEPVVPPANLAALDYFIAQGGRFTVATGRAHRTFAPHVHSAPINAPVILSNGAQLYDFSREEMVLELLLDGHAPEDLLALSAAFPQVGVECYHGDDVYIHRPNEYTHRHVIRVNTTWSEKDLGEMPRPWSKAVIQADYPTLLRAQAWMQEHFSHRYEVIFSNPALLECTAKGATKGGMVLRLAKLLGIERENIYCIGDNQNDIPMLALSAIPFAPADCAQAVKDWGATLVCPCAQGSIAQVVEVLEQRYK